MNYELYKGMRDQYCRQLRHECNNKHYKMITKQCLVLWTTGTYFSCTVSFPALPTEKQKQALLEHWLVDIVL